MDRASQSTSIHAGRRSLASDPRPGFRQPSSLRFVLSQSRALDLSCRWRSCHGRVSRTPHRLEGRDRRAHHVDNNAARGLAWLLDRTSKFQPPEMLKPTNRWASRDALAKDFVAARDKTICLRENDN